MAKETKKMDVFYCDACPNQVAVDPKIDLPPLGLHGKILIVSGGGGYSIEFYSCTDTPEHIVKAIKRARDRELENG